METAGIDAGLKVGGEAPVEDPDRVLGPAGVLGWQVAVAGYLHVRAQRLGLSPERPAEE